MGRSRQCLAALVVVAAGGALAGCGSGGSDFAQKSAGEIQTAAVADMKDVTSLTMKGDITSTASTLGIEISLNSDSECDGSLTMQDGTAQFRKVEGRSYLKGDQAFWENSTGDAAKAKAIVDAVGDKWVALSGDQGFGQLCDLDQLLSQFGEDQADSKATKGKTAEVDGEEAVSVVTTNGGQKTTGWVATEGKHYLLKIQSSGGGQPGQLTFSDFNDEVTIEQPAADEVVDAATIG